MHVHSKDNSEPEVKTKVLVSVDYAESAESTLPYSIIVEDTQRMCIKYLKEELTACILLGTRVKSHSYLLSHKLIMHE